MPQGASADSSAQIIVKREPGLDRGERADIRADAGVRLVRTLSLENTEVVSASNPERALDRLNDDADVEYAELDRKRRAFAPDPYIGGLWGLENTGQGIFGVGAGLADADIDGREAWASATGTGQIVAVVDSGIDAAHEDLAGQLAEGRNFVGPGTAANYGDGNGHGTHVAGTIAALRDNGLGVAGVAPGAKIMALRVLDDDGAGWDSDIAEAFRYAGDAGVRVVNASLGGTDGSHTLQAAIDEYPDTLFVVAAGNDHRDNDVTPNYPCQVPSPNVLCVGASTNKDTKADFSNYGDHSVDAFAPGEAILSTVPSGNDYAWYEGTSMAAPHVAAAAALVMQVAPLLSAVDVKAVLLESTDKKAALTPVSISGGRINANAAVQYAVTGQLPPDADRDGFSDASDACPTVAGPNTANGCPVDVDGDGVIDVNDNCPAAANPGQGNADLDGVGDACDASPRGPDVDGDGKAALDDQCPTVFGAAANGCPAVQPPILERIPAFAALSAKGKSCKRGRRCARSVKLRVRADRTATVRVTVERRKCSGKRCRWVRVARRSAKTHGGSATFTVKRLKAGAHRAKVSLANIAGTSRTRTVSFRIR